MNDNSLTKKFTNFQKNLNLTKTDIINALKKVFDPEIPVNIYDLGLIYKIHPNDIAMILDQNNVAIRTGHHCAQPLLKKMNLASTARASFGIYNDKNDVDCLIEAINQTKKFFN